MVKRVGKYEIGKTLGEGTFGKVKFAINTESGLRFAIKILDKEKIQKQNMGAQIKKEISIMKMVSHDYVVELKEVLASRTKIFIVLELITGGELFDKIVAEGRFDEPTARFYANQLVDGVLYCHGQGVCHRDLKPENLLLDDFGNLKISDFGLSALYDGDSTDRATLLHTTCGTPNYVAPEVLADRGYDGRAADVWSIGVILYVLLAGFLPFDEPTMPSLFRKIQKAEFSYPAWFASDVRGLLDRVLVVDPKKRISLQEVKDHPWMASLDVIEKRLPPPKKEGKAGEEKEEGATVAPVETRRVKHTPSAQQIREAVTEGVDVVEGPRKKREGPKLVNAFDIINMCGGQALHRMFQGDDRSSVKRQSHFMSQLPPRSIMKRMATALEKLTCTVEVSERNFKVRARILTPKGEITMIIVVYSLTSEVHLVEVRRGKGDILEYHDLYKRLCKELGEGIVAGGKRLTVPEEKF